MASKDHDIEAAPVEAGEDSGRRARRWLWPLWIAAGWWLIMFTLTHWPRLDEGGGFHFPFPNADKMAHFGLFCGWFIFWAVALGRLRGSLLTWSRLRIAVTLLILGAVYAVLDETTQAFIPGRDPSIADFAADAAGLVSGWVILTIVRRSA